MKRPWFVMLFFCGVLILLPERSYTQDDFNMMPERDPTVGGRKYGTTIRQKQKKRKRIIRSAPRGGESAKHNRIARKRRIRTKPSIRPKFRNYQKPQYTQTSQPRRERPSFNEFKAKNPVTDRKPPSSAGDRRRIRRGGIFSRLNIGGARGLSLSDLTQSRNKGLRNVSRRPKNSRPRLQPPRNVSTGAGYKPSNYVPRSPGRTAAQGGGQAMDDFNMMPEQRTSGGGGFRPTAGQVKRKRNKISRSAPSGGETAKHNRLPNRRKIQTRSSIKPTFRNYRRPQNAQSEPRREGPSFNAFKSRNPAGDFKPPRSTGDTRQVRRGGIFSRLNIGGARGLSLSDLTQSRNKGLRNVSRRPKNSRPRLQPPRNVSTGAGYTPSNYVPRSPGRTSAQGGGQAMDDFNMVPEQRTGSGEGFRPTAGQIKRKRKRIARSVPSGGEKALHNEIPNRRSISSLSSIRPQFRAFQSPGTARKSPGDRTRPSFNLFQRNNRSVTRTTPRTSTPRRSGGLFTGPAGFKYKKGSGEDPGDRARRTRTFTNNRSYSRRGELSGTSRRTRSSRVTPGFGGGVFNLGGLFNLGKNRRSPQPSYKGIGGDFRRTSPDDRSAGRYSQRSNRSVSRKSGFLSGLFSTPLFSGSGRSPGGGISSRQRSSNRYGQRTQTGSISRKSGLFSTPPSLGKSKRRGEQAAGRTSRPPSASGDIRNKRPRNFFAVSNSKTGERAWNKDIARRKLRTRNQRSSRPGPFGSVSPYGGRDRKSGEQRARRNTFSINIRSITGSIKNRRPKNPYAVSHSRKGEQAWNRDIARRNLRTRNKRSERQGITLSGPNPYEGRTRRGEQAYPSPVRGNLVQSISPRREEAWERDLAGKRLHKRNYRSPQSRGIGLPKNPPGKETEKATGFSGRFNLGDIGPRLSGGAGDFRGDIKAKRKTKGGGYSIPRLRNNRGESLPSKGPGSGTVRGSRFRGRFNIGEIVPKLSTGPGNYRGDIRSRDLAIGGGNLRATQFRGRLNMGDLPGISPSGMGGNYRGDIKAKRPDKGGGSVKPRLRNKPLSSNPPGSGTEQATRFRGRFNTGDISPIRSSGAGSFRGDIKTKRPDKGGGRVKPRLRNNPLPSNPPGSGTEQATRFRGRFNTGDISPIRSSGAGSFRGDIKARRPDKGGGSVKPRLRNNPLPSNPPGSGTEQATRFRGRFNMGDISPIRSSGAGSYSGNVRAKRPAKGGGSVPFRLHNNREKPLETEGPGIGAALGARYQGNLKQQKRSKTMNFSYANYSGNSRTKRIKKTQQSEGVDFRGRFEPFQLSPGFNMSYVNYRGDFKTRKVTKKHKHPSVQFTSGKSKNAKEEKEKFFNFKLLFSRIFKKNEDQPKHLKENNGKPRYDKKEAEIWYD